MFLDTSGLLCFLFDTQPQHQLAVQHFTSNTVRFSHSLVLAELVSLCTIRKCNREKCLEFVDELLAGKEIEIVVVNRSQLQQGIELLKQRQDKSWSLCDAVSFILMQERNMTDALTTDHHFAQAGFNVLLRN